MTKKIILLSFLLGTTLWATSPEVHHLDRQRAIHNSIKHTVHQKEHHMVHKELKQHSKALRRTFKTAQEFRHVQRKHRKIRKHLKHVKSHLRGRTYGRDRYAYNDYGYGMRYENHIARGFRHYRNSWYLAFRYEKASFYDNEGFYYGYFDHRGYTFEGEFYRYDRYYTYRDRVRGRGLFTHRYFRPVIEYYSYNEYDSDCHSW